jgi:uncharacterized protein (TIGR03118 family)
MKNFKYCCGALLAGFTLFHFPISSGATTYTITNLVTNNQAADSAQITDTGLVNAWGLSFGSTSPFWVSSNGNKTAELYKVDPITQATTQQGLVVSIPGAGNVTGQVFNSNASAFNGDPFLFVSEDGTVSGWRGALGSNAEVLALASTDNVYKGSAISSISGSNYLYAANFHTGAIDVIKGTAGDPSLSGSFADPNLPSGYAPFNVQNLKGFLYVTYAAKNGLTNDEITGLGLGIVDKFDLQGNFLARIATGNTLNAPWGLALAPSSPSYGGFAGALLVGNFGDGRINAFDLLTYAFLGQLLDTGNTPLEIDGLWAISPGNDGNAGNSGLLYFTAGPNNESNGLFGVVTPYPGSPTTVPEPSTYILLLAGMLALLMKHHEKSRHNSMNRP